MTKRHESDDATRLQADEARWMDALRDDLDPGPRPPARRTQFAREIEERIAEGGGARRGGWWLVAVPPATGLVVAALVLFGPPRPVPPTAAPPSLLAVAYYETDYLGGAAPTDDFLGDDYRAIADAFALDDGE